MAKKIYTYNVDVYSKSSKNSKNLKHHKKKHSKKNGKSALHIIKKAVILFSSIILLIGLFFLYNLQYISVDSTLIATKTIKKEIRILKENCQKSSLKITKLTNVNRITTIANQKYKLDFPKSKPKFFYVDGKEWNIVKTKSLNL